MLKKALVGLGLALLAIGAVAYWWHRRAEEAGPAIAALPPAQALAFFAAPGWPQAWDDLRRTKYFHQASSPAFWQGALGLDGYQRLMEHKRRLEQRLGVPLTEQTVARALRREFAVTFVPRRQGPWPIDVIAYIRISTAEKIAEGLARLWPSAMPELERETHRVDGVDIITLRPQGPSPTVSYAVLDNLMVVSSDAIWVADAIRASRGPANARLQSLPAVREMQLERTESLLAYGYYDAAGLQAQLRATMTSSTGASPPEVMQMLQPTSQMSLKAMRAPDGIRVDAMARYPAGTGSQVFRRTEADGATPPYAGVPAETFYLTHVDLLDLQGLWHALQQLAAPGPRAALQRWLARFRADTGVDLERDVLPVFTGAVGFGFTSPFGAQAGGPTPLPGLFLTFGVSDEARARQLVQTVGNNVGGPLFTQFLERKLHDGQEISYVAAPLLPVQPGYVVSRQQLIVGSDLSLLQHMLDAATGRTPALADTRAFQEMRQHVRLTGGSVTFADVSAMLSRAKEWRARISWLAQILAPRERGDVAMEALGADPWRLLELLRPIRYAGAISRGEAQGIRTEAFIALDDLQ
jgi:hypothetical protein